MENADVFLGLHDFLERMRQPSAADFVKSIKSFIVSFSNNAPDPERDSGAVQEFLAKMEADFRAHPLWAGCSEEELDSAGEGLEKYVMTKLFTRVFASLPDDVKHDKELSEKMSLIQQFIRPENLDIKTNFQNETSWLKLRKEIQTRFLEIRCGVTNFLIQCFYELAQKELQKINMYKAPRDKLVCILNCCKVISNLLLNASIASNDNPPGADEFLPVLIYVTIKANLPQLHSNLLYIQRYRRESRLVSEAAYFFTNMQSVESFISNIDAKALSMDESEFEKNMETARALLSGLSDDLNSQSNKTDQHIPRSESKEPKQQASNVSKDSASHPKSSEMKSRAETPYAKDQSSFAKIPSLSDLENKGAQLLLKENQVSKAFQEYPYLFATAGDLTVNDVEDLLTNYKQLVFKYVSLAKALGSASPSLPLLSSQTQVHQQAETVNKQEERKAIDPTNESTSDADSADVNSNRDSLFEVESLESKLSQDEAVAAHGGKSEETTQS